ncbi:AMP-binding protein [Pendulispora albinea]|uniref:AMP-binding protein n=1 Tax=Pendulispora albinea TaxID=2741071 RepID=A0ABZ2M946_9BACT
MATDTLLDSFIEHAIQRPDKPALTWHGRRTTYGQLYELARYVHRRIENLEIPATAPIGVLAPKSPESIALILGCLLARRRFLLPSPDLGETTLRTLFSRGGCRHVLTPELTTFTGPALAETRASDAVSFMLTTSCLAGVPKIVPITGEAIDRFTSWAGARFAIGPQTRVLNYAPLHFHLCLLDIWTTLRFGGCAVLVDPVKATQPRHLVELLKSSEVHLVQAVPMLYQLLADATAGGGQRFESVERVLFTGDAMPARCLDELGRLFPRARYYNVYGCTETNASFLYELAPEAPRHVSVPLGEPLPGVDYLLVDEDARIVTGAGVGEIYVSTPFQARNYLGGDEAEKFAPHPIDGGPARFFRSGDIIRRDRDGTLTRESRNDFVVKVRGTRVDTQVVEAALGEHGQVAEAVVIALPDAMAGHLLHAIVRRKPQSTLNGVELRQYCADRLPGSAMPSTIQLVDEPLPRSTTGQIDRRRIASETQTARTQNVERITQFIVEEFLPDLPARELAADYDLLAGGVIDSLGLLKVFSWLEESFGLAEDEVELTPENFRSVKAIEAFIDATSAGGRSA